MRRKRGEEKEKKEYREKEDEGERINGATLFGGICCLLVLCLFAELQRHKGKMDLPCVLWNSIGGQEK